ncbi:hypothetical protein F2Q70_00044829 [Brassica cretica]|uniref:Uncharacterized protein n=1 Tax=Brassica cretica TaxID=69181 RepID=A0A3N6T3H1_BRACR|nr:hypothetical protein F2Q70_00044829 [Brassica cretica]KAF3516010.1 hypothetical protein DY000_02062888 [Brassica cretica]
MASVIPKAKEMDQNDLLLHRQPPTSLVHPVSATPPPASPTTPPLAREMEFADIPKKRSW